MFKTLRTLIDGSAQRADTSMRDRYALELIDQKIREAEAAQRASKKTLAALILRHRTEQRMVTSLDTRIGDLMTRAGAALADGKQDMAEEAATVIADLENEKTIREETVNRLDGQCARLRAGIDAAARRLVDLRQGAIAASAVRAEQRAHRSLVSTQQGQSSAAEAQDLIDRVLAGDDAAEEAEILREIDDATSPGRLADRMADAGFGVPTRVTPASVLARLQTARDAKA